VFQVTPETQGPDVGKITFASPFGHRSYVIRVPETPALCVHIQLAAERFPFARRDQFKPAVELERVESADSANAAIALENLLTQIAGICPQSPFVNAEVITECPTAGRYLLTAPPADAPAVRPPYFGAPDPASGLFPVRTHYFWGRSFLM